MLYINKTTGDYWKSAITHITLKSDFSFFMNEKNTLRFGYNISPQFSDPGNLYFSNADMQNKVKKISQYRSAEYSIYALNEHRINSVLSFNYGLRIPLWQNYGPQTVYIFDENFKPSDTLFPEATKAYSTFICAEPRITMNYLPAKGLLLSQYFP